MKSTFATNGLRGLMLCLVSSLFAANAIGQVGTYSQDFEGLDQDNLSALDTDGWKVFVAVYSELEDFKFSYGPNPAPNVQDGTGQLSNIENGQGGVDQGSQYLNAFSDYNCCNPDEGNPGGSGHQNGTDIVVASVFQERTISTGDIGRQVEFIFDAKIPDSLPLGADVSVSAYIQTLDPDNNFATTAVSTLDLTSELTAASWSSHSVLFNIDVASFDGQLMQFGYKNSASNYQSTGVYYDNVRLRDASTGNGDFDNDLDVDGQDFLKWQQDGLSAQELINWENTYGEIITPSLSAVSAVPEPTAVALLLLGIVCLNGTTRRDR